MPLNRSDHLARTQWEKRRDIGSKLPAMSIELFGENLPIRIDQNIDLLGPKPIVKRGLI